MKREKKAGKNKIVFCAQDAGGFNAIFPVINALKKKAEVLILLTGVSRKLADAADIFYRGCDAISDIELDVLLKKFDPDVVVCGTSTGLSLDKKAILWAKENNIPTIAIVDFWSNYKMRFSNPGAFDLAYLPDVICVIDGFMKKQMEKESFDSSRLFITGNPYFDTFKSFKNSGGKYILFAEQPFSEVYSSSDKSVTSPIFNEIGVFSDFIRVLEKAKIAYPVIISFHPRSKNKNKFDKIITHSKIKIKIAKEKTEKLLENAKIVIGINGMVLFEAALGGKTVLSYQPGIKKADDVLMSNRLGLSEAAYNYSQLEQKIKRIFSQKKKTAEYDAIRRKYINNNSTGKVIKIINKAVK